VPEEKKEILFCDRCKQPLEDVCFVHIQPALLLQKFYVQIPPIFTCPEHAENYAQSMRFHTDCWMDELRDHGVPIHDMTEVKKRYAKEALEKLINENSSSLSSEKKEAN
jgi:hypothetical protein